jgi:hypothetical protein
LRTTVSTSRRTPWATPAASFISRAISSKNLLLVWVMPSLRSWIEFRATTVGFAQSSSPGRVFNDEPHLFSPDQAPMLAAGNNGERERPAQGPAPFVSS